MISIAMATYNGERFIREQLDSILKQTILPDEIVIRDDRSSDRTMDILDEYKMKYTQVRWDIRKNDTNLGFIKNFLGAINACSEDIIILCDQDDVWKTDKVEKIIAFFSNPGVLSIHGDIDIIDSQGNIIRKGAIGYKKQMDHMTPERFYRHLYYCGMSSAFRRSLVPDMMSVDPDLLPVHDWLVHAAAVCRGGFYTTSEVLAYRRFHGDNVALNLSKTQREGVSQRIEVVEYYCRHYELLSDLMERISSDSHSIEMIRRVLGVNRSRINYLKKRNFGRALLNVKNIRYYPTPKAYLSDLLYLAKIF